MRNPLADVLRHTSSLFVNLICKGTETETIFEAMSPDKSIIFSATLKEPIAELAGESVFANLSLLNGLLNFASYNTETATMNVTRAADGKRVEGFEFKDGSRKAGAIYRSTNPSMIREEDWPPNTGVIKWLTEFEPQKAKLSEFGQLSSLYSEVEKVFMPKTEGGELMFIFGDEGSSNHRASMVFQEGVDVEIKGDIRYKVGDLQSTVKLAGADPCKLHLTSRGVIMVSCENSLARYTYIIRAAR